MIEADGVWIVLENQGGTGFVLRILLDEQDVLMPEVVQDFILAPGRTLEGLAFGRGGGGCGKVKPNEAFAGWQLKMLGFPVLVKVQGILKK
jgi:hypothetical protein